MTDKINTYEKLGRFVMNEVYNILLKTDSYKIDYNELKRRVKEKIDGNPKIDKTFAEYKYNHGASNAYLSTYRWENVLFYYLIQHQKAAFLMLSYYKQKQGIHDYVELRKDYLLEPEYSYSKKFHIQTDMNYMFDWAQSLNKGAEEEYLHQIRASAHLDKDALEQLLEEIKKSAPGTPPCYNVQMSKVKSYYSNLQAEGSLAEFRLYADEGIVHNYDHEKRVRTGYGCEFKGKER